MMRSSRLLSRSGSTLPKILPEVLVGRLVDHQPWAAFDQRHLPAYQIPAPIRQADSNLRYNPLFELVDQESPRLVRLGDHVLSYHQKAPYVGWAAFRQELFTTVDALFQKAGRVNVKRLGFRYINALKQAVHGVGSVLDLDLKVEVAGESIPDNMNLSIAAPVHERTRCMVRVGYA